MSVDVKSLFTRLSIQLALDCTGTTIMNSKTKLPLSTDDLHVMYMYLINLNVYLLPLLLQALQTITQNSYGLTSFCCCTVVKIVKQSRDGAVVRALTSHQCGPGSIPVLGIICVLSLRNGKRAACNHRVIEVY